MGEIINGEGQLSGRAAELPAFAVLNNDNITDESTWDETEKSAATCPPPLSHSGEPEGAESESEQRLESKEVGSSPPLRP